MKNFKVALRSSLEILTTIGLDSTIMGPGQGLQAYVMNDENDVLDCRESDIVVKGTLFLRNLRVNAEKGCRLYVSGSVFIEGSISYVGSGVKQNLQITSSNAISMGINLARLKNRLLVKARNPEIANVRTYADRDQRTNDPQSLFGSGAGYDHCGAGTVFFGSFSL